MNDVLFDLQHVDKQFRLARSALARMWDRRVATVLQNVSLTVRAGDSLGIVGESGSGKTTLARLMVKLLELTAGQLRYRGVDLAAMDGTAEREFRQRVQMVFQSTHASLNPRKTVDTTLREAFREAPQGSDVRALLEMVRLPATAATKLPHELSGGQRQRVGIARALARRPELLIADEPTSALDVSLQREVIQLLRELRREMRLTLVVITHDLAMVSSLCETVLVLNQGHVVEQGSARQVLYQPAQAYTRDLIDAIPRGYARRGAAAA